MSGFTNVMDDFTINKFSYAIIQAIFKIKKGVQELS
jgi:hypothetical protein